MSPAESVSDHPLTVCVVTHRRPDLLAKVVSRLEDCAVPESYAGLVVVENGGCQESRKVVEGLPVRMAARHIECSSRSKCSALNAALREIERGLIVFTDDDTEPSERWLTAYAEAYSKHGSGFYFGGPNEPSYDVIPPDWLRRFLPASATGFMLDEDFHQHSSSVFLGFNWGAEAEALRACGGFSRRFGPGTERGTGDETLMQFQLAQRGVKPVCVADARIRHYVPVERCSAAWSLERAAVGAFIAGIQHEWYHHRKSLPNRPWRSALRRVVNSGELSDVVRLVLLRPSGVYWARRSWIASRNFVQGIAYGAQHHPLDPQQWAADGLGRSSSAKPHSDGSDDERSCLDRDIQNASVVQRS